MCNTSNARGFFGAFKNMYNGQHFCFQALSIHLILSSSGFLFAVWRAFMVGANHPELRISPLVSRGP